MSFRDYELIRNTIATYAVSIDKKDYTALANIFTSDARLVIVGFDEKRGGQATAEGIRNSIGHLTTHHSITTQKIDLIDDSNAKTLTYCTAEHWGAGEDEGKSFTIWLSYDDHLVKAGEEWKIKERIGAFHRRPIGDVSLLK